MAGYCSCVVIYKENTIFSREKKCAVVSAEKQYGLLLPWGVLINTFCQILTYRPVSVLNTLY